MIRAWEKLETFVVKESFDYLILGEKWEGYGPDDCAVVHTCKYWRASSKEKKLMIFEEIKEKGFKNENGKSLMECILESLDSNETRSVDQIKDFIERRAQISDGEHFESQVNDSIRRLLAFKILKKDYTIENPTFKLKIDA